jgi:DNA-binding CsgD family transcriptional regulator
VLYGRDAERDQIGALLKGARESRSAALVVRGEPGIGKTALLEDTRERATDMHVLSAHPVESEAELPFAALHQLLRPALGHVDRLPAPQAYALRVALGLEEGTAQERFLVFAACLSLLSELAERRPVLCVVDDAHWLDTASAEALLFVARRLDAEGIVMLFGAREGDVRSFEAVEIPSLLLGGLDADAASTLLERASDGAVAASVVDRLVAQARGNALALIELPHGLTHLQLAGEEPLPATLPLTRQVERIFLEQVRRLPEASQRLLLIAAADDSEDLGIVLGAAESAGVGAGSLDAAERSGLLSVHGTRIDFRHPLVRSAVYGAATSSERRAAHGALAGVIDAGKGDADRRAWHLAASVVEPSDDVVQALEDAAARAEDKGGYMAAAKARERAAELASDESHRGRLLADAARCAGFAGADDEAVRLATAAGPLVQEAWHRAEIVRSLALARIRRGRPLDAVPLLLDAARQLASSDPAKALDLLLDATLGATDADDVAAQSDICALGGSIEPPNGDEGAAFVADFLGGLGAIVGGDVARAVPLLERAVERGGVSNEPRHLLWAATAALFLGDDRRTTALLKRAESLARAQGAIGTLVYVLGTQTLQDFLEQRFDDAALGAADGEQFAREVGSENPLALFRGVLGCVSAIHGDDEKARSRAERGLAHATAQAHRSSLMFCVWALGLLDLGRGRWPDAYARLASVSSAPQSFLDSIRMQIVPDRIEAAVRASYDAEARGALEALEGWAAQSGAPWARPRVLSCRALVVGGDTAGEEYERALELAQGTRPFDLARIHLLYGEHLRRVRRRADSRLHLRTALDLFERMRAAPWAERAASELRATGETARKRDLSAFDQLTQKEVQIARLVAEGMSNKEVAAQLFLSPRTIDYHLRNVFTKLGLTSRTQLARIQLDGAGAPANVAESARA